MTANDTLKEIGRQFMKADSILLFPHENVDGDALGSCVALCKALRDKGKEAYILIEGDMAEFLKFLDKGYCSRDLDVIKEPDICACIDCGDVDRFKERKDKFFTGKTKICIDHHVTSDPEVDYRYVDGDAAAAGEIIFKLFKAMDIEPDQEMAEALFAAITTDTGNFQYSNTTKESHMITGELYDAGIDANKVSVEIYETVRPERIKLQALVLSGMEIFADGEAAIACVTQEMLKETGTTMDETEGIASTLRSVKGVQIAAFLKEKKNGEIKVSLRAKRKGDVAKIGARHGGGGHVKAAGCSLYCSLEEAAEIIKKEVEESLSECTE
ncbi:MAG: bifunctional oligoribonuclease/PAP phosphatase NrnA [Bacillota bacterium]|nr:bifunctional oligoribonuclease/PAP phosphatase NrnA [Bacillota bacterium]